MGILCAILSLPISIFLVRWLMKKKMENPFEKSEVSRLVLAGMLSMVVAAVVTLLILCVRAYRLIGIDTLKLWMSNPDPETVKTSLAEIRSRAAGQTYLSAFIGTFLSVGLVEELSRFLFIRLSTGKKRFAKTWLDLVICGSDHSNIPGCYPFPLYLWRDHGILHWKGAGVGKERLLHSGSADPRAPAYAV